MATLVFTDGLPVFTLKLALLRPAETVMLAGRVAMALLLVASVTTMPPEGAAPESVTVPWDVSPPLTVAGLSAREDKLTAVPGEAGVIVNVACFELAPRVAVMTALVAPVTDLVLTVNLALVLPAATVTLGATVAAEVLALDKVTTIPPEGALAVRVTVPVELLPPVKLAGFSVNDETLGLELPGFTVKLADTLAPPDWAKIGAVQLVVVALVITVKVAVVLPAGIVTGLVGKLTGRLQAESGEVDS
jgi:hypothetical protein